MADTQHGRQTVTSENRQQRSAREVNMVAMELDPDACYRALSTRDARFDGRLFVGVKTTGIYCRPICPARTPRRENVLFYASAAAAQEAGFRPCLRCRPDCSPELASWRGTSNTVVRALGLIEQGALDDGDVESLAERLGVGGRQLRRLFAQHLGASPNAVAQTRRVLLAKQLLHDTQLSMTMVASAAGFGSVRRFNETFLQLYQRPPSALRKRRGEPARAGEAISLCLSYVPPYDFTALLGFLSARAIPGVELVTDSSYARSIAIGDESGTLHVRPSPTGQARIDLTVSFSRLSALPSILGRVRRIFDLGADPIAIAGQLRQDPTLAPLVDARPGLRVPGAWDGFELAVRAVLGQQITVGAATKLCGTLVSLFGAPLAPGASVAPGLTHVFPTPARLAGADLSVLPMPRARSLALTSLARAVADDPSILTPQDSLEEAVRKLRALPGIGEWTAQYIAMRALREPDAFPAADVALQRALARADGSRPSARQLLAESARWSPWRAYAALHLWASLSPKAARDKSVTSGRRRARAA
jgi:AraC family transcriptional regulator of adaptative response / DNA-3-methyladenine glycosylase II